jgi:hypothetical protein
MFDEKGCFVEPTWFAICGIDTLTKFVLGNRSFRRVNPLSMLTNHQPDAPPHSDRSVFEPHEFTKTVIALRKGPEMDVVGPHTSETNTASSIATT